MIFCNRLRGGIALEWQQIEYFIAVAKSQHMTNAAKQLSVTQPALSRSIATLEKEVGVELFERRGRNLALNRYGQLFLERAQNALKEIEKAKQEIANEINPWSGVISLCFPHIVGAELFPTMLGAFRERYADIRFELNQCSNDELAARIHNNDSDFGITTWESVNDAFHWQQIGKSELYLAVPLHHPWADKKEHSIGRTRRASLCRVKALLRSKLYGGNAAGRRRRRAGDPLSCRRIGYGRRVGIGGVRRFLAAEDAGRPQLPDGLGSCDRSRKRAYGGRRLEEGQAADAGVRGFSRFYSREVRIGNCGVDRLVASMTK
ncbi:LysR family transcriptional regulator [Cohnella ginsengisoli]|uniref:LysR family transcriptional regulator n=1 Tax=Cohnella ginsengisoli TaxID=425004 RepID=A0A9X4KL97_9BACL|nr:LysR family transcriptional regulator [Cohnella ginsengisoli]MDG0794128.1 LysR family transcriptional regulator [Cohnella ginsengisoli]